MNENLHWYRTCVCVIEGNDKRERKKELVSFFRLHFIDNGIVEIEKLKNPWIFISRTKVSSFHFDIKSIVNFWLLEGFKDTINPKGSFRKNFSLNLPLLLGEREPFPGWHSSSYPIGNRGRGSAIFVQLGCIHHTALCKSESRKLSTSISRRERNEKRGSRYFVYMPRFLHFISPKYRSSFFKFWGVSQVPLMTIGGKIGGSKIRSIFYLFR